MERIKVPEIKGPTFGNFSDPKTPLPDQPSVLIIFPVGRSIDPNPEYLLSEALKRDLSRVKKIRFDPINSCNLSCLFCPSNMEGRNIEIKPESIKKLLTAISKTCHRIVIGCGYEPLYAKNFVEYGRVFKDVIFNEFNSVPVTSLTTNGTLLLKYDLSVFAEFLSWLHISIASQRKDYYEMIERGANFSSICQNIKAIQNKHDTLRIHIEMVLNQINLNDVDEFIPWAFQKMNVGSVNIRRVQTLMRHHSKSNLS